MGPLAWAPDSTYLGTFHWQKAHYCLSAHWLIRSTGISLLIYWAWLFDTTKVDYICIQMTKVMCFLPASLLLYSAVHHYSLRYMLTWFKLFPFSTYYGSSLCSQLAFVGCDASLGDQSHIPFRLSWGLRVCSIYLLKLSVWFWTLITFLIFSSTKVIISWLSSSVDCS